MHFQHLEFVRDIKCPGHLNFLVSAYYREEFTLFPLLQSVCLVRYQ